MNTEEKQVETNAPTSSLSPPVTEQMDQTSTSSLTPTIAEQMDQTHTSSLTTPVTEQIDQRPRNKMGKSEYILSRKQRMTLTCEWADCVDVFEEMDDFLTHITEHLRVLAETAGVILSDGGIDCEWRNCNHVVLNGFAEIMRHVYFHGFHIKLKSIGMSIILGKKLIACTMSSDSRNIIPDLPERFHCGWKYCEVVSDNPYYFYEHVKSHAEEYPAGRKHNVKCKCCWEGCEACSSSRYKLIDHLRSHTQEKMVACPTCGSLFSASTKYVDHLKRQEDLDVQSYQCSHCSKKFPSERLLKDHMRKHVNNYKCPFCEMTTPSPSTLRKHIKYRHSDERDFKCNHCDASFKSNRDRQRHIDVKHGDNSYYACTQDGCGFKTKHEFLIKSHIRNKHGEKEPHYVCDTCKKKYTRGRSLTTHLMAYHNLRWPPGHKKFRYKLGADGDFHLQTVRYESYELTQQLQTERRKKALAGLNSEIEKIKHHKKSENSEPVLAKLILAVAKPEFVLPDDLREDTIYENQDGDGGALDLSKKSIKSANSTATSSLNGNDLSQKSTDDRSLNEQGTSCGYDGSLAKEEYAYNLSMLGDVASKEQTIDKENIASLQQLGQGKTVNGEKKSSTRGRKRGRSTGKKSHVKTGKHKSGEEEYVDTEVITGENEQNIETESSEKSSNMKCTSQESTSAKPRKRVRKDSTPSKLLVRFANECDEKQTASTTDVYDVNTMPKTVEFVTEIGQVIVVDANMTNSQRSNLNDKTQNDHSSGTYEKTQDGLIQNDYNSETHNDNNSETHNDNSSETHNDNSSETHNDNSSETHNDKSSETHNDKSSETHNYNSSETHNDNSSETHNDQKVQADLTQNDNDSETCNDQYNDVCITKPHQSCTSLKLEEKQNISHKDEDTAELDENDQTDNITDENDQTDNTTDENNQTDNTTGVVDDDDDEDDDDDDDDCNYYTVVAGDSENIVGLISSKTGVYTPIPKGYILNVQSSDNSPSDTPSLSVVPPTEDTI